MLLRVCLMTQQSLAQGLAHGAGLTHDCHKNNGGGVDSETWCMNVLRRVAGHTTHREGTWFPCWCCLQGSRSCPVLTQE